MPPEKTGSLGEVYTTGTDTFTIDPFTVPADAQLALVTLAWKANKVLTSLKFEPGGGDEADLTLIRKDEDAGLNVHTAIYKLEGAALIAGANKVFQAIFDANASCHMSVQCFKLVDTAASIANSNGNELTSAAIVLTINSCCNDYLIWQVTSVVSHKDHTPTSGQSEEWERQFGASGARMTSAGGMKTAMLGGNPMNWTLSGSDKWATTAVLIKLGAAPGAAGASRMLMGVGA